MSTSPEARERLDTTVEHLDESIRLPRQAVFGLGGQDGLEGVGPSEYQTALETTADATGSNVEIEGIEEHARKEMGEVSSRSSEQRRKSAAGYLFLRRGAY